MLNRRSSLLAIYGLAAVAKKGFAEVDRSNPKPAKRQPGPVLEVNTHDGKVFQVHKQQGKVLLVDFMTTTCPSCKQASYAVQKLYQELGPKGFLPVAVALDANDRSLIAAYRQVFNLTFTMGITARQNVVNYLRHPPLEPMRVPTLVLLDRRGRVFSVEVGWRGEEALRASVLKLLAE